MIKSQFTLVVLALKYNTLLPLPLYATGMDCQVSDDQLVVELASGNRTQLV